jgi:hypothetical protein
MKPFGILILCLMVVLFLGSGLILNAQEQSKEEQEMQKKWAEYSTPGPNHKYLESFTGEWEAAGKMWMNADSQPIPINGEMKGEMILGGRYYKYSYKSEFMGMPMEGVSIIGYDNFNKEFFTFWIDNMGTGMFTTRGTLDKTGKIRTETGLWDDIMSGGKDKVKIITRTIDKDKFGFEMYMSGGMYGDKEFKSMEIIYTRKKQE